MVDGEQHFARKRNNKRKFTDELTQSAELQQQIDSNFNKAALASGHNVLRLHHADCKIYAAILFWVLKACRDGMLRNRIAFSDQYPAHLRLGYGNKLLDLATVRQ